MEKVQWPTLVVTGVGLSALGVAAIWGRQWGLSSEAHMELLTFLGSVGMVLLSYMRAVYEKR